MIEHRVIYHSILSSIWNNGTKGTVILAPGLPQYIDKYHPLLMAIEELELTLFTPRYKGTWESGDEFSFTNCIETLNKTIELAQKGTATELFGHTKISWNKESIYLLGFSFGALPALFIDRPRINKILLCPFISQKFHTDGKGEPIEETYKYLEKAFPNIYRFKADEFLNQLSDLELPMEQYNLTVGAGRMDSVISQEEIACVRGLYNVQIHWLDINHSLNINSQQLAELMNLL